MAHLQGKTSLNTLTSIPAATDFSFLPHELFHKKIKGERERVSYTDFGAWQVLSECLLNK